MVEAEARPPVGLLEDALQEHRGVDGGVAEEEEHGDDGRDDVDVAGEHAAEADEYGEGKGPSGLALA